MQCYLLSILKHSSIQDKINLQPLDKSIGDLLSLKEETTIVCKVTNSKSPGIIIIPSEAYTLLASGNTNTVLVEIIQKYLTDENFEPHFFHEVSQKISQKQVTYPNPNKWHDIAFLNIYPKIISFILSSIHHLQTKHNVGHEGKRDVPLLTLQLTPAFKY